MLPSPSFPPHVDITGVSPAVRKVVWPKRFSGKEGGEQSVTEGKISVEEMLELKLSPPTRKSKSAASVESENCGCSRDEKII